MFGTPMTDQEWEEFRRRLRATMRQDQQALVGSIIAVALIWGLSMLALFAWAP